MSEILDPLTFDELSQIERESKAGELKPCRPDLYPAMAELLNRMRREYENSIAMEAQPSVSDGFRSKLYKAEAHCKKIITARSLKIVKMAVRSADGVDKDLKSMTEEERDLYEKVVGIAVHHLDTVNRMRGLKEKTTRIDSKKFTENPKTIETQVEEIIDADEFEEDAVEEEPVFEDEKAFIKPTVEAAEKETPSETVIEEETEEPDAETKKFVLVRIIDDIPPFAGAERDYYLSKEDLVTLPENMAIALINSNKAVKVNPGL